MRLASTIHRPAATHGWWPLRGNGDTLQRRLAALQHFLAARIYFDCFRLSDMQTMSPRTLERGGETGWAELQKPPIVSLDLAKRRHSKLRLQVCDDNSGIFR